MKQHIAGHAWTVGVHLARRLRPPPTAGARRWQGRVDDPDLGSLALSGWLHEPPGAGAIVVIVHGLGGSATSGYALRAAALAGERSLASLRVNLRGADLSGEDFYHAGLIADLRAALSSPEVRAYPRRLLLGYSIGGHVALRLVADRPDLADAVATICAPVDLAAGSAFLDHPARFLYRRHLLSGLYDMYEAVSTRRPNRSSYSIHPARARSIRTMRGWDDAIVAPRFGFADAADYYHRESAGPRLSRIERPTLFVAAEHDPMVPARTLTPHLATAAPALSTWWIRPGGHVGFPPRLAVEARVFDWLARAGVA